MRMGAETVSEPQRPAAMPLPSTGGAPSVDGAPAADLRDLHVSLTRNHQAHAVLRGVDLRIERGEILGLVGESGSGKSVLGLTLLGLLREDAKPKLQGTLLVDGVDMRATTPKAMRALRRERLGAVFQDPMTSLDPTMRIDRQLREVVDSDAEALELLRSVGIPDAERRMRQYPHELSGGLRQRVMIAIAVAGDPRLIVADEPTTALDVTVQAQILELLDRMRRERGCSVVFITHDLAVASQIADRIAVLYAGRIAEIAPTAELLTAPRHPYTAALLRSRVDLATDREHRLVALPGQPPDLRQPPTGCAFAPRCAFRQERCDEAPPAVRDDGRGSVACLRAGELDFAQELAVGERWPAAAEAPDPNGAPAIEATALEVSVTKGSWPQRRTKITILRGVDLTVAQGEAIALVGESGSGKTTFVRAVAGLVAPTGGQLTTRDDSPQMVFQDAGSSLTPWMTVEELVGERLRNAGMPRAERRQQVLRTMELVGLPERLIGVRPAQLSGGQRQRVGIARAVVVPPRVLLCDEPTSALDVSVAAGVLNLLGELRRRLGMAMVFVTHDLAVARVIADRVAVMHEGRLVEVGPTEAVLASPTNDYTRRLIASIPALRPEVR